MVSSGFSFFLFTVVKECNLCFTYMQENISLKSGDVCRDNVETYYIVWETGRKDHDEAEKILKNLVSSSCGSSVG